MRKAPGPQGYSLLRVALNMWWSPLTFLSNLAHQYGDVVCVRPGRIYLVNHPDHVRQILHERRAIYSKSKVGATTKKEAVSTESTDIMPVTYQERRRYLGFQSVVRSENEAWRRQRSMIQPVFSRAQIGTLSSVITGATAAMLARWKTMTRDTLDVEREILHLVRSIVVKAFFGHSLETKLAEELACAAGAVHDYFDTRAFVPIRIPENVPTKKNRRFRESFQTLSEFVDQEIARRAPHRQEDDLLQQMLDARDDDGNGLSKRQMYDEALMLSIVGHQTTAAAAVWALSLISSNSMVETSLRREIDKIVGERRLTIEDLPKLIYLRQVLEESLRLFPPTWVIPRRALQDDDINGFPIPAGADVVISPYVLHRHPDFWKKPEVFDPGRFAPGLRHPAYIPFGYGERICMASNFALLQASLIVVDVVRAFRLEVAPGHRIEPNPRARLVLQPRGGMPMTLHSPPRRSEQAGDSERQNLFVHSGSRS